MLSTRTGIRREPNALALALEARRAARAPVLDLTLSNPTRAGLPYARAEILAALADPGSLVYAPEPFGLAAARAAVSEWWTEQRIALVPERVALCASTSEAYGFLFKLLCDPGDEVLVPQPSYPLFEHLARLDAVRLVPYRLAYDGAWHIDFDSLDRARTPRTRAVLVVSPNNPTGSYVKRDELARLAATGLPLIADEVFAGYPLSDDARRATTALEATDALVFSLGGLSKLAALPQMKLAWICAGGPDALVAEAFARLELVADTYLSVATPVQLALPRLLATRHTVENAIRARSRANLQSLIGALAGSAASVLVPEGGWYACVRLPRVADEERWVVDLLERDGVLVQPGWFYDFEDEPFIVVSLITPEAQLASGAAVLRRHVDERCG